MMAARYEDEGSMTDEELRDELITLLSEKLAKKYYLANFWFHPKPVQGY